MIDLSNDQLQATIHSVLNKEEGLNELLEMILNGLMKLEREAFLSEEASPGNKGNGYLPGRAAGYGKELATRQVGEITEKIYGNHYSSSAVSNFNQQLAEQFTEWRRRPWWFG